MTSCAVLRLDRYDGKSPDDVYGERQYESSISDVKIQQIKYKVLLYYDISTHVLT